jgi:membrane-associated phospholipid phosphatase
MVWHRSGSQSWEWSIMNTARRHPLWGATEWRSMFEPVPFALIMIAIAGIALLDRRPKLAFAGTAGCVLTAVSAEHLFKPLVERRQPYHWSPWFPDQHLGFVTFPSGHVAGAAACAMFAWFVLGRRTPFAALAFLVPLAVAWAMIALRNHYPADTIAGYLLGVLVVSGTVLGTYKVFGRDEDERATDARPSGRDPIGSS